MGPTSPLHREPIMQPELNIYVCSTVRHLLFALLRADLHREEPHHILFFADYQHTSLADWHLELAAGEHYRP